MSRTSLMQTWLVSVLGHTDFTVAPASSDASFRSYHRVSLPQGNSFIVMDAPSEHEDCRPFVRIAELLRAAGVNTPRIQAQSLEQGFLLLEDFGSQTYLDVFAPFAGFIPFNNPALPQVRLLLGHAIDSLVALQQADGSQLPPYDEALLRREVMLFPEWFAAKHLNRPLTEAEQQVWEDGIAILFANITQQAAVPVHRDFTVRNLMLTAEHNPGVLDFQDAVVGPISYDILSLTRDAFIGFDDELVLDCVVRYWEQARKAGLPVPEQIDEFWRDVEWMGVQRHLKVAGIFARLHYRDGKSKYLAEIPRFLDYIRKTCNRYEELRPLGALVRDLAGIEEQVGYTF